MIKNYYISNDDYNVLRCGLLDDNSNVVKTSIQSLITQLEENKLLNNKCTKDLCAILYRLVQNSDYKIRKWIYHLIAYKNTKELILRCVKNLTDGLENDIENITWIMAIASIILPENELYGLYKKHAEGKISSIQYKLCTMVFSVQEVSITQSEIRKIVDKEDFLSKMWLTKIYACAYRAKKKKQYVKIVNTKLMNELLQEEELNRYALWAFSTSEEVNLKKIDIRPCDAVNLSIKSQGWFYTCLFKDKRYVIKNRDHVEAILDDFFLFSPVIQSGILRGLERVKYNLGYMESKLVKIYFDLDEEDFMDVSLLISLTQIFLNHVNESNELKLILRDVKENTTINAIKSILIFYNYEEKEKNKMERTLNFYGQNQYNEKAEYAVQNNFVEEKFDGRTLEISKQITNIVENLKEGHYDAILNTQNTELANMVTNFQYEVTYGKSLEIVKENILLKNRLNELEGKIIELKNSKLLERKNKFSDMLTEFSEVCTVVTAMPQMVDITQNMMMHIKNFLNI